MTLRTRLAALLASLAVLAGVSLAGAPAALAGNCTTVLGITRCGHITHDRYSGATYLRVTGNYGSPWSQYQNVARGREATYRDDDGYYVPTGWYGRQTEPTSTGWSVWIKGPTWVKVTDLRSVRVQLTRF